MSDREDHKPGDAKTPLARPAEFEDLLRRLAHELRTPLAAIAARAQVIRSQQFGPVGDPQYVSYAETIESSADLALQVLESAIQDIVMPEGEQATELIPTDLAAALNDVVEMLEPVAADFGVRIECAQISSNCLSKTNPTHLKQILLNLITNAIKFTPLGGVVTVSLAQDAEQSNVIEVTDNGLGFAPAELAKVTGSDGRGRHGYGIVNDLKRRCGGDIEIRSVRGQGTCVRLTLPVVEA